MSKEITPEMRADLKALTLYCKILDESMPPNVFTVGNVETDETVSQNFEIVSGQRFVDHFSEKDAKKALNKFKDRGFEVLNNFDWYYRRVSYLNEVINGVHR